MWKIIIQTQGGPLAQTIPPSRIDAINDNIKPVVDTIMDKGKFQLQQTIYPCKCGKPAQQTLLPLQLIATFPGQIFLTNISIRSSLHPPQLYVIQT